MSIALGSLKLASRWILAPLAGHTELAFRIALRELGGVGLATTDLVNARALVRNAKRTMELIQTRADDQPLSVQIYGADPQEMALAAQWLENRGTPTIDINMGCPVHKVCKGGGGSALMCQEDRTIDLVRTVVEAVRIPVTVKMRLGWDDNDWSAPFFAREFEKAGVAGLTIHGRTREQGFSGHVKLPGIQAVVEAVERIPIFGNGDVRSLTDAQRMREETGCTGVAIGRGALLNPWIFAQLDRWERTGDPGPGPTRLDRLVFMERHFRLHVDFCGERHACVTFRKLANWYCRVLRPGHELQQRLVLLKSVAEFDEILDIIRCQRVPDRPEHEFAFAVKVPTGPIAHW